jgi:hypothetical protein
MEVCVGVMPLQTSPTACFLVSYNMYYQRDGCTKSFVMTPVSVIFNDDCWRHRAYACNSGMAGHIFTKFGMNVVPMEASPDSYLLISYYRQCKRDGRDVVDFLPWNRYPLSFAATDDVVVPDEVITYKHMVTPEWLVGFSLNLVWTFWQWRLFFKTLGNPAWHAHSLEAGGWWSNSSAW